MKDESEKCTLKFTNPEVEKYIKCERELMNQINFIYKKIAKIRSKGKGRKNGEEIQRLQELLDSKLKELKKVRAKVMLFGDEMTSFISAKPKPYKYIQNMIKRKKILLVSYYVAKDSVLVFTLDGDKIHYKEIKISKEKLNNKITFFRIMIKSIGLKEWNKSAKELYTLLWEPVESVISNQ